MVTKAGTLYEGFWSNNELEGKGRSIGENGDVYCGDWKDGLMSGDGTFNYANGQSFTG